MNWIDVNDRLPTPEECKKYSGWFLTVSQMRSRPELNRFDGHEDWFLTECPKSDPWKYYWIKPLHWMPLPDMPENICSKSP